MLAVRREHPAFARSRPNESRGSTTVCSPCDAPKGHRTRFWAVNVSDSSVTAERDRDGFVDGSEAQPFQAPTARLLLACRPLTCSARPDWSDRFASKLLFWANERQTASLPRLPWASGGALSEIPGGGIGRLGPRPLHGNGCNLGAEG